MLSRKEHHGWFLTDSDHRKYHSEMEERFFKAIENPPEPSDRLKEMVSKYGKYAVSHKED